NSPYDKIKFKKATSEIRNPDGSVVFRMENIEVPAHWSQVAIDVLAQKYFRKAGVPDQVSKVSEDLVPVWLQRSVPYAGNGDPDTRSAHFGSETSATQVFDRLAGCWSYWGWKGGYLAYKGTQKRHALQ